MPYNVIELFSTRTYKTSQEKRINQLIRTKRYRFKHPEKIKKYQEMYRNTHPRSKEERREIDLFYKIANKNQFGRMRMLFELGGCCVFCFNKEPFELESHHPFGRKEHPEIMLQVCTKCHKGQQPSPKLIDEYVQWMQIKKVIKKRHGRM